MGRSYNNGGSIQPFEGQEILSAFICPVLAASANDYFINNRGFANASALYLGASAAVNLTGLVGATPNRDLLLFNIGASSITLKDTSGASLAANRFLLGADVILKQNQSIKLIAIPTGGWGAQGGAGGGAGATSIGALVTQNVLQVLASATNNPITWDTKIFDTGAFWSAASDTKFTVPTNGLYLLNYNIFGQGDAGNTFVFGSFRVNGINPTYGTSVGQFDSVGSGNAGSVNQSIVLNLLAGDFVEAMVFSQTTTSETVVTAPTVGIIIGSTFSIVAL